MSWIRIANANAIPLREGRNVDLGDREIAIFNLGDRYAAIDAACPHRSGPLCDGIVTSNGAPSLAGGGVTGHAVVCPLHGWRIDLETGHVLKPEVPVKVNVYEVLVRDGIIEVEFPDDLENEKAA